MPIVGPGTFTHLARAVPLNYIPSQPQKSHTSSWEDVSVTSYQRRLPDIQSKRIWQEILGIKRLKSPKWGEKREAAGEHRERQGWGGTGNWGTGFRKSRGWVTRRNSWRLMERDRWVWKRKRVS